jgi:hypothetical protein
MNTRERFLEVMDFNPRVRAPKWEYAYWGSTMKRWYAEGLPEKHGLSIPTTIHTTTSSLYTTAWTHGWSQRKTLFEKIYGEREQKLAVPDGMAIWGGALYWPSQGFPLDHDVADFFGFDKSEILAHVEQLFCPQFEPQILEEDDDFVVYVDLDGVTRRLQKKESVIPTAVAWPIRDWPTWLKIKEERLRLDNIRARFPPHWPDLLREYKTRDYPLALGGYPLGFFGTPAHLMGYTNLFFMYHDQPDLVADIVEHLTTLWIAVWEEVLAETDIDVVHIWEDVSSGKGSMISPRTFRQFLMPCYQRVTGFLKSRGVRNVHVDTDGDCRQLIPLFLEAGVTGLYPMEVSAGMDVVAARREYPQLQILGGIPKMEVARGPAAIDAFLEPVNTLLEGGGYIPFGDHSFPPDIPWEHFRYYRERLNRIIDSHGEV